MLGSSASTVGNCLIALYEWKLIIAEYNYDQRGRMDYGLDMDLDFNPSGPTDYDPINLESVFP